MFFELTKDKIPTIDQEIKNISDAQITLEELENAHLDKSPGSDGQTSTSIVGMKLKNHLYNILIEALG